MNLKGSIPIIKDLLYPIPVNVYDHSTDRWRKDKARIIKPKKSNTYVYEFAKHGPKNNTLPLYKRAKGKMFVYTNDGRTYQPMKLDINKNLIFIPNHEMEEWRDIQMRKKEERYKPNENTTKEVFKSIGLGIAIFLIIIAIVYFITSIPTTGPASCNCQINGVDLSYCQEIIANTTGGSGGFT